jgi:hypothetical protein
MGKMEKSVRKEGEEGKLLVGEWKMATLPFCDALKKRTFSLN